jgi:hypothetical protein
MNTKLVKSITQVILSLSKEEQDFLKQELSLEQSEPSISEFMQLSQNGGGLDFLYDEPDLYTLADGEPIQ